MFMSLRFFIIRQASDVSSCPPSRSDGGKLAWTTVGAVFASSVPAPCGSEVMVSLPDILKSHLDPADLRLLSTVEKCNDLSRERSVEVFVVFKLRHSPNSGEKIGMWPDVTFSDK